MPKISYFFALILVLTFSCHQDYVPKPHGYFRIDFQKKAYHSFDSTALPYKFDIPDYGKALPDHDRLARNLIGLTLKYQRTKRKYTSAIKRLRRTLQNYSKIRAHWPTNTPSKPTPSTNGFLSILKKKYMERFT